MSTDFSSKLFLAALAFYLTCSADLLTYAGVPYVSDGGLLIFKIHPGSYLLYASLIFRIFGTTYTRRRITTGMVQKKPIAVYCGLVGVCIAYSFLLTDRGNLVVFLDTFLPAGIAAAIVADSKTGFRLTLRGILQAAIFLNALLALSESVVHTNIIPLYLNSTVYSPPEQEFRPTALFDHPLTGSMVTLIGLAIAPSRGSTRALYSLVLTASLVAFGGRVATAMAVLSAIVFRSVLLGRSALRHDKGSAISFAAWTGLTLAAIALLLAGIAGGLGQRLSGHLYWDPSAEVRLSQWAVISELSCEELLFGTQREEVIALLTPLWLTDGVEVLENFWLLMFVSLGALGFVIFLSGFGALMLFLLQQGSLRGNILLISTIVAASTSNSLGRKSSLLVILIAAMASLRESTMTLPPSAICPKLLGPIYMGVAYELR